MDEVSPALDKYFPRESGVRIIAEPGRFFVASAFTLCVNIVAKRVIEADQVHNEMIEETLRKFQQEKAKSDAKKIAFAESKC